MNTLARRDVGRRRVETKADTRVIVPGLDVSSCHCLLVCVGDYLKIDRGPANPKSNTNTLSVLMITPRCVLDMLRGMDQQFQI